MLSFGHAAYFGVGAFATVHAMNALGGTGPLPTPLMPLVGAPRRPGLRPDRGLVRHPAQRHGLRDDHAGDRRTAARTRTAAQGLVRWRIGHLHDARAGWGLSFGSTTQVYYLTLAWVLVSLALLYFHTRTPLGRLTLALRENEHRLRFLGYDAHGLGVSAFAISAMFSASRAACR